MDHSTGLRLTVLCTIGTFLGWRESGFDPAGKLRILGVAA